ncbi:hypothetical protein GcM1_169005 [Golovinomyces cichoracearum]|uniref:Uncharacterized protein n=1 Tax=Golovinomyces cichoracearum TaxID=62708 RepID=A0A420J755_9PEZI|nr:hypothetical protein GcM1_169005 [Golovinomyces cichoracearum]
MICLAILWAAALSGGIYERAIVYNFIDGTDEIQMLSDLTYHTPYITPMYVPVIEEQQESFEQTSGSYFSGSQRGKAKYFRVKNYASYCNEEKDPVVNLWKLAYGSLKNWEPPRSYYQSNTRQDMNILPKKIETVSNWKTLVTLLSLAQNGVYRISGNNCFFPWSQSRLDLPSISVEKGVSLSLVTLNKYVETLRLEGYTYAFIVDKFHGFNIASVKGKHMHYSNNKVYYFLRASYKLHVAFEKNPPLKSERYNLLHFVIGHSAGSVSSAHDVRVGNSESVLVL